MGRAVTDVSNAIRMGNEATNAGWVVKTIALRSGYPSNRG